MRNRLVVGLAAVASLGLLMSCTIYSTQSYGVEPRDVRNIKPGQTVATVLARLGAPDIIYEHASCDALVYKYREGSTILTIVTKGEREDGVVVVSKAGKVISVSSVPRGEGFTIIGVDTVPISISGGSGLLGGGGGAGALNAGPDNYNSSNE